VGPLELLIVLLIVVLIFGRNRLPGLGRQVGEGVRNFKDSVSARADRDRAEEPDEKRAAAALDRPAGDEAPLDGEVMRERS
jgi:sec-independent protein translocase protein TatA